MTNSNIVNKVAVKVPGGSKTDRKELREIEIQGRVMTSIKCSIQIDSLGKEAIEDDDDLLYKYKDTVSIPPLGMINDVLAITECGVKTIKMNAIIQNKVNYISTP